MHSIFDFIEEMNAPPNEIVHSNIHTLIPFCFNRATQASSTASHTRTFLISTGIFELKSINWIKYAHADSEIGKRTCFDCWKNSTDSFWYAVESVIWCWRWTVVSFWIVSAAAWLYICIILLWVCVWKITLRWYEWYQEQQSHTIARTRRACVPVRAYQRRRSYVLLTYVKLWKKNMLFSLSFCLLFVVPIILHTTHIDFQVCLCATRVICCRRWLKIIADDLKLITKYYACWASITHYMVICWHSCYPIEFL